MHAVTLNDIRLLRDVATITGDTAIVETCNRALDGCKRALAECRRLVRNAQTNSGPHLN